jgi:hypothetical protein
LIGIESNIVIGCCFSSGATGIVSITKSKDFLALRLVENDWSTELKPSSCSGHLQFDVPLSWARSKAWWMYHLKLTFFFTFDNSRELWTPVSVLSFHDERSLFLSWFRSPYFFGILGRTHILVLADSRFDMSTRLVPVWSCIILFWLPLSLSFWVVICSRLDTFADRWASKYQNLIGRQENLISSATIGNWSSCRLEKKKATSDRDLQLVQQIFPSNRKLVLT